MDFLNCIIRKLCSQSNDLSKESSKSTFLIESRETFDHIVYASIKTIKYLNGPKGGCIGPQISS